MQEIQYKQGVELWRYRANSIIKGVPVSYFDADTDAAAYLSRVGNGSRWKASIQRIIDNFDLQKFGALFYCRKCKRMEDGAHRLVIARERGIKTVDVRIGGSCYKRYVKAGRVIRRDSTFRDTFEKAMKENPTSHKLDPRWLEASVRDKWPLFSGLVDFRGKSFLDVGCNVGYSCVEAWGRMARESVGIEVREDVLKVADAVKAKIGVKDCSLSFLNADWSEINTDDWKFDIVMSMGLFHYFKMDEYERLFNKLLSVAKETVILELRLRPFRKDVALIKLGSQTLPTARWLLQHFKHGGFKVTNRFVRKQGSRELWIAEKV